jgi:hypothetical protein
MRWMLFAASAAVVAGLALPGDAAQPPPAAGDDKITFEQYRDWRNDFIERRQSQLAIELAAPALPAERKARLTQVKAYYDWLAGLPAAERDRRYRERFGRIDANHDGIIDAAERAAWRDRERAFYNRGAGGPRPNGNDAARDEPLALPAMQQ